VPGSIFNTAPEGLVSPTRRDSRRAGLDFADALLEIGEQDLAADRIALGVEPHALDVLAGVVAHAARRKRCPSSFGNLSPL
jgi:hypothetical protein